MTSSVARVDLLREGVDLRGVGDVGADRADFSEGRELFEGTIERTLLDVRDHDLRSVSEELLRDSLADVARAAGHYGDLVRVVLDHADSIRAPSALKAIAVAVSVSSASDICIVAAPAFNFSSAASRESASIS